MVHNCCFVYRTIKSVTKAEMFVNKNFVKKHYFFKFLKFPHILLKQRTIIVNEEGLDMKNSNQTNSKMSEKNSRKARAAVSEKSQSDNTETDRKN